MLLSYFVLHTSFMLSKSINKRKRKKESEWTEQAVAAIAQGNIDEIRENERFIHSYNYLKQEGQSLLMVAINEDQTEIVKFLLSNKSV